MRTNWALSLLLFSSALAVTGDARPGESAGRAAGVQAQAVQNGITPEALAAKSWDAREALQRKQFEHAQMIAAETQKLAVSMLGKVNLQASRPLQVALGAAIEVQAMALSQQGERGRAVELLRRELRTYWDTPIRTRIQKNLNLLDLENKPAPPLDVKESLGPKAVPLSTLKGRPVLLFFWAHWCGDCKRQIPAISRLKREFGPSGLVVVGPTQHYGYTRRGEEASRAEETRYIDEIRTTAYAQLSDMPVPVSEENFRNYGASTTPTLVLIDRQGIVRMFHPGQMDYEELSDRVEALVQSGGDGRPVTSEVGAALVARVR